MTSSSPPQRQSTRETAYDASKSASCLPCQRLLRGILDQPTNSSRCKALLQSMGYTQWVPTSDGVALRDNGHTAAASTEALPAASETSDSPTAFAESKSLRSRLTLPGWAQEPGLVEPSHRVLSTSSYTDSTVTDSNSNDLQKELHVTCRPCMDVGPEAGARAFVMGPQPLSIVICSNRIEGRDPRELQEILSHELVHVYDAQVLQMDLRECQSLAFSEVRAAHAAECSTSWYKSACVRNKALSATSNLFPLKRARECVQSVLDRAMADTRPFAPTRRRSAHLSGTTTPSER